MFEKIKAANKTVNAVMDSICENLKPYHDRVLTLTYDNVLNAEWLADLASGYCRIEVPPHLWSMSQFGVLANEQSLP